VVTLRCTADDSSNTGYVEGDEILLSGTHCNKDSSQGEIPAASVIVDSTNVVVQVTDEVLSNASKFLVYKKSDATQVGIGSSASKFVFRIRVWATGAGSSASNNAGPLTSEAGYYFTETGSQSLQTLISTGNKSQTFVHGFNAAPRLFRPVIVVTEEISDLGYVAGDEFDTANLTQYNDVYEPIFDTSLTSTSIKTYFRGTTGLVMGTNTGRTRAVLTADQMSKMKLKVYAWK